MDMMNQEQTYIAQILDGEIDVYRRLVERYQTGLIIHCENIVKDRQDAEDIAQEAFIKAYRDLKRFQSDKARFSTWLYRIATNLCFDQLRKNKRQVDIPDIETYVENNEPDYSRDIDAEYLRKAIDSLKPPKYGAIIQAYFWEGRSYQALADEYDTTTGTIGTWITRAKLQLKEKLNENTITR